MNNYKWSLWLPILKSSNAKYEYEIISKEEDFWTFGFDVTEYSGEKHSHKLVVNVETGEGVWL